VGGSDHIDDLRRRVDADPASIAFARLAEEYRRAGKFEEAVRVGRAGLTHHPNYLSAHVTLARALTELGRFSEARGEFQFVIDAAPDNLAAIRGLADLHQRSRQAAENGVEDGFARSPEEQPATASVMTPDDINPGGAGEVHAHREPNAGTDTPWQRAVETDPALESLESWLTAIEADRVARDSSGR